jgi:acylglycerol lipase
MRSDETGPIYLDALAVWRHPAATTKPKARILLIHGISEHSGRHGNTIGYLMANGYEVVRFDLRGAGQSGGRRQWITEFSDYVSDTASVFNWICHSLDDCPLIVLGHSLGGAVATHFAAEYGRSLQGLVLSAPAFLVGPAVSSLTIALGKALVHIAPTFSLPKNADGSLLSRDPSVAKAYMSDPLACHNNTLRQATEILKALTMMPTCCERITTPVMIAHGTADKVIRVEGSFELMERLASKDRTLHIMPDSYHELHNDIDKEVYFGLLGAWLAKRT